MEQVSDPPVGTNGLLDIRPERWMPLDILGRADRAGHRLERIALDRFGPEPKVIATGTDSFLEQLSEAGVSLSELRRPFERYTASGELNTTVDDPQAVIERIASVYADADQDRLDGLTVDLGDWWFNLRPSNTEPYLRLVLEARTRKLMDEKRDLLLSYLGTPED